MNALRWIGKQLDDGWFSRLVLISIAWFAWTVLDWSMRYAGTVLAMEGPKDLQGCALVIGAVGMGPVAILTWGLQAYMSTRQHKPTVIKDRRRDEPIDA